MSGGGLRKRLVEGIETVVAVGLVLVFFVVFMIIIGLSFPEGTNLNEMMFQAEWASSSATSSSLDLELAGGEEIIASLIEIERSVQDKPSRGIAWQRSNTGMPLGERHAVQTLSRSEATISFGRTERLTLDENALIVIRQLKSETRSGPRRASVVALEGAVRGRVEDDGSEPIQLEVVTASGEVRAPSAGGTADFEVTINPDQTSTYTVLEGTAEVSSAGRSVRLGPGDTVTVAKDQPPPVPVKLPGPPDLVSPAHESVVLFHTARPDVRFAWSKPVRAEGSHVVISRDPAFEHVVYDERLPGTEIVHANLQEGVYYWRVTATTGWASGPASPVRTVHLVRDDQPPVLRVAFPTDPVTSSEWLLRGEAEPGSTVFIGDRAVRVRQSGEFEHRLELARGLNVVTVEAVDRAGNIAYRSHLVNAKY